MARTPRPTDAELSILRVLWARGPSTVREIHDHMADTRSVAYTTTLKTLQVMTDKGLTMRADVRGQHVYRPRNTEHDTLHHLVTDLLDRAFGGSTARLVIQALSSKRATPEELQEIRRLLDAAKARSEDARDRCTDGQSRRMGRGARPGRIRLAGRDDWRGHRSRLWNCCGAAVARARYLIACTGLAALCAAPVATGFHLFDPQAARSFSRTRRQGATAWTRW